MSEVRECEECGIHDDTVREYIIHGVLVTLCEHCEEVTRL